jgi:hypothetical protein
MAYTLDVVLDPAADQLSELDPPLFRRQFSTSRFGSPGDLANDVRGAGFDHEVLDAPISGLAGPSATDEAVAYADEDMEAALLAAGAAPRGAAEQAKITVFWSPTSSGSHVPSAILIDAAEPLWRERSAPRLEVLGGQDDPGYTRVVPGTEPALGLRSMAGIGRFVRSTSGTRTLAFLEPATSGAEVLAIDLRLVRHASSLFSIAADTQPLFEHRLPTRPPWEVVDE